MSPRDIQTQPSSAVQRLRQRHWCRDRGLSDPDVRALETLPESGGGLLFTQTMRSIVPREAALDGALTSLRALGVGWRSPGCILRKLPVQRGISEPPRRAPWAQRVRSRHDAATAAGFVDQSEHLLKI